MREMTLVLIGLAAWASPAPGQAAPRGPVASVVLRDVALGPLSADWLAEPRDSVVRDIRPTYWKEGAAVGGLVGVVGGALAGRWICGMSDEAGKDCGGSTIVGAIGGAVLLAIPGALIGGQFRKGD